MAIIPRDLVDIVPVSPPQVYLRLRELLSDPGTTTEDMARVIAVDPALTGRLLKLVNSAFYGLALPVETVSRAITVVGTQQLAHLVLVTEAVSAFNGITTALMDMDRFWRHSVYVGVVARILAQQGRANNAEMYFTAGLLHDIGSLMIYHGIPDLAQEALYLSRKSNLPLHVAEQQVMDFDHAAVGAELMRAWHLPTPVTCAVEYHHAADRKYARDEYKAVGIVHLADALSSIAGATRTSETGTGLVSQPYHGAWAMAGLSMELALKDVVDNADAQFEEALSFLDFTR
ncbi:MAG: HDOD domain-containing protein [Gammaproteobacteria bacterium]|nr:HDOD domain-containing protein [Gammaproteobacteria bacterium]